MQHPSELSHIKQGILPKKIREFMATESAGGYAMILFTALALMLANSPASAWYQHLVHLPLTLGFITLSLSHFIQDGLMVLFFLVVGLELKREMAEGFLSKRDQIILPLIAAVAGMAAPALIFLGINHAHPETLHGWAIPSATDIAFALAILSLISRRFPPAAKIFLLAIAIFDDLGAIIIIALFYNSATIALTPIALCLGALGALYALNRWHISHWLAYTAAGLALLAGFALTGIHTTLAGVIVGLAMPLRSKGGKATLSTYVHFLHPYVSFLVIPLFAFVSAGVDMRSVTLSELASPIPLGIMLGLFLGKQLGIFGSTWLMVRLHRASLPQGARWTHIYGVAVLAGIGFTMSLFIGMLAYREEHLHDLVKLGVLSGSALSALYGLCYLKWLERQTP